jgi:hypothetical protein
VCSCSKLVRFSIFVECVEKNILLNRSNLFWGMGFNNLGCVGVGVGGGGVVLVWYYWEEIKRLGSGLSCVGSQYWFVRYNLYCLGT